MKRKIVVLGGGISGYGSAILAKKKGFDTFLTDMGKIAPKFKERLDEWGVEYEEGQHSEERIQKTCTHQQRPVSFGNVRYTKKTTHILKLRTQKEEARHQNSYVTCFEDAISCHISSQTYGSRTGEPSSKYYGYSFTGQTENEHHRAKQVADKFHNTQNTKNFCYSISHQNIGN